MACKTTSGLIILQNLQLQYNISKIQTFIKKIQTYLILVHQFSILVYQFLSLQWTKKSKTNVNYGAPHN